MRKLIFLIVILPCLVSLESRAQNDGTDEVDSMATPFRPGRWFTGISGSISANRSQLGGATEAFSTQYSFDFFNGRLVKGRWLPALRLSLNRASSNEFGRDERESLFIAPAIVHYLFKNSPQGSVFIGASFGYTRFFQRTSIQDSTTSNEELLRGNGFGGELNIGYSYAITDHILFDLGMDVSSFRVSAKRSIEPNSSTEKETLNFGGVAFSFGFNVLLDDFFF